MEEKPLDRLGDPVGIAQVVANEEPGADQRRQLGGADDDPDRLRPFVVGLCLAALVRSLGLGQALVRPAGWRRTGRGGVGSGRGGIVRWLHRWRRR